MNIFSFLSHFCIHTHTCMVTSVRSFHEYARSTTLHDEMLEKCVGDMEQGLLHVDTVDSSGMTLGVILWSTSSDQSFWDRYWALSPDVGLFWVSLAFLSGVFVQVLTRQKQAVHTVGRPWCAAGLRPHLPGLGAGRSAQTHSGLCEVCLDRGGRHMLTSKE